jgi:hypothetical protein
VNKIFRIRSTDGDGNPVAIEIPAEDEQTVRVAWNYATGGRLQILSVEEVGPADQGGTET